MASNPWCFARRPRCPRCPPCRQVKTFSKPELCELFLTCQGTFCGLAIEGTHIGIPSITFPTVAQVPEKGLADHKVVPLVSIALGVHIRWLIVR